MNTDMGEEMPFEKFVNAIFSELVKREVVEKEVINHILPTITLNFDVMCAEIMK